MRRIKTINQFYGVEEDESFEYPLSHMDDISDVVVNNGFKSFKNCRNNNIICESTLNRLIDLQSRKEWAIITAYRREFTKPENIKRNRKLRGILDKNKMGVHQLIGRWEECSLGDVPWDKCPKEKLKEVFERSYFVAKPENLSSEEFLKLILSLMTIDGKTQDAIVYSDGKEILTVGPDGEVFEKFTHVTLGKIERAYSRHIKKQNVPFVFEGLEIPGSISGMKVMAYENIKYIV